MTDDGAAPEVLLCVRDRGEGGSSCGGRGARQTLEALTCHPRVLAGQVRVGTVTCFGRCTTGPVARVRGGEFQAPLHAADVDAYLDAVVGDQAS